MKKKLVLTGISLILFLITLQKRSYSVEQKNIPSDLSLDLIQAQQNPAPEQKQIVESQMKQVTTTTETGEYMVSTPNDIVPSEIETESTKDVVNPEQTTSEQVITTPVEEETDQKQNEVSPEPDDNAAPTESPQDITPSPENNIPLENNSGPTVEPTTELTPTTSSVQGVETGPNISIWQMIINLVFGRQ